MTKIGFDNETYLQLQSKKILERVDRFGGKLYLEFGGKLFDDYHASRVLPGFEPDAQHQISFSAVPDSAAFCRIAGPAEPILSVRLLKCPHPGEPRAGFSRQTERLALRKCVPSYEDLRHTIFTFSTLLYSGWTL